MNLNCKCGTKMVSADANVDSGLRNQGHVVYATIRIRAGYASWVCPNCRARRSQKLRKAGEPH